MARQGRHGTHRGRVMTEPLTPPGNEPTVAGIKALASELMVLAKYLAEHPEEHAALIAKAEQGSEES
jgi:hypothetical protein